MRGKLERIAAGAIEYRTKPLKLSVSSVVLSCAPGGRAGGSFTLSAERSVKGVVYASTTGMSLESSGFQGRISRINFCYDAEGLWGGEVIEGEFVVVSDAGEYRLPYTVRIEPHEAPKENYTYFVTADPIEPLVETAGPGKGSSVVYHTGGAVDPDSDIDEERLSGIVSQLIKNGNTDPSSFVWYRLGVERELKLTNIYEYFMMTVPEDYRGPLPTNLLLYFKMENHLSDRQKALLYADIIRWQSPYSEIYRAFADEIEEFMLDQLLKRRISKNLSVIYREFLMEGILTIDFAEALADIMFLRLLKCSDRRIREVVVFYDQLQNPIHVPINGGEAYVPIYTPGAVILLADARGSLYSSSVPYTLEKLMDERRFANKCCELLRYHQGLYLYLCDGASKYHRITEDNVENYKKILKISGFTAKYKEEVRQEILQYYYDSHGLDELDRDFFLTQTESMNPKDMGRYVEILILRSLYDDAWDMVRSHGFAMVRVNYLIRLAVWRIKETEYAEDDFLVKLCFYIFTQHKYHESILEYLSWYYAGACDVMIGIQKEACAFEMNVFELEERILAQMLFTGGVTDEAYEIYRDYRNSGGGGLVSKAYLAWLSYEDFVRDGSVPEGLYDFLEEAVEWDDDLPDVCLLSYLRSLSGRRNLRTSQKEQASRLMDRFLRRRIRYSFMKSIASKMGRPWILEDKTFVEYRTDPSHKVVIHYCMEIPGDEKVEYVTERIYPSQPGVFVKEFTLFYGWTLTWFFVETDDEGNEATTSDTSYTEKRRKEMTSGTKYAYVYEMSRELSKRSTPGLEKRLMEYGEKNYLVESLFSLK